jgi:tetratricopeptide (TPR) repeat protein
MINFKLKIDNFCHADLVEVLTNYRQFEAISLFKTLLIFGFVIFSINLKAATFENGNKLYAAGKYEDAIKEYEAVIAADQLSTDIYFNLGNAYYKTENVAGAILNYEKAIKLKPDNEDALFNLKMANKRTVDKIDRLPELFIGNTWRNLVTSRTVSGWSYYCVGLIFLSLLFFVIYLLMRQVIIKKTSFYAGILFFLLSLFSWLMASQHNTIIQEASEAIIFSSTITVQSEPNENAEKLFTLHEGTKVKLLEEANSWSKIKLPNGNVGWISSEGLKSI